ncbi:metallophosphoesterase family protein [bacterium]|nr:metallophosphoesterase family protein [bacterium]
MKWSLLVRWSMAACCLPLVLPTQAVSQSAPTQAAGTQALAPCFRTDVPAHPFDLILGRPTNTSVTASVLSYTQAEAYLEGGTRPGNYTVHSQTVQLPAGEPVSIVLQSLLPDTAYYYRLQRREGGGAFAASDEFHFHTQRPPGSTFTFTVIADSHLDERTDTALYQTTLRNALAEAPDFHLDLGDTFMAEKVRGLGEAIAPMYLAQRYYLGLLCRCAPLFFVTGNHDEVVGGQDTQAIELRRKHLPNPLPDGFYSGDRSAGTANYYAWTWGDALFVVLDPFTYSSGRIRTPQENWNRTLGEAQYRWLQRTLEASQARYKFVFLHNLVGGLDKDGRGGVEAAPYFEWGGHNLDGSDGFPERRPGWELPIHQLLVRHKVTAVFHGHDHFYARQELDGIVYQEVPQPGWVGGERVKEAAGYGYRSGQILPSSGHLHVKVTPGAATIDYVRSYLPAQEARGRKNGLVADSCRLTPIP